MTPDMVLVFGLLLVTVVLFIGEWLRLDVVAILVILALMLSGILSPAEALAGFGDPVVILIAGLFVVGEGLFRTGVAYAVGNWMTRVAGDSETRLLVILMLVVAGLSAFMSSTGAVAICIPVVLSLAAKTGAKPSMLLMPVAFASLIGGMLTLIGTPPNLVVSTQLTREGMAPFGFFEFTPIGLLILGVGIVYILLIGRRLLPQQTDTKDQQRKRVTLRELIRIYGMQDRFHRVQIKPDSLLTGLTVGQARLRSRHGVTVVGVERKQALMPALMNTELRGGDTLYVVGTGAEVSALANAKDLRITGLEESHLPIMARDLGLVEVLLTPDSKLIGRTLKETRFRDRYELSVLAVRRKGEPLAVGFAEQTLEFGDSLLIGGGWRHIRVLQSEQQDFLVLSVPEEMKEVAPARARAPLALLILLGMLLLMTFKVVATVTAVMLAALAMVLGGCVTMKRAYTSMSWESLVLIAGMLPMATALENTGGIELIVNALVGGLGGWGPLAVMAGLFVLTSLFSQFISNTATTVLVAPIAFGAATTMDVSPYPLLMTVALAASTAFSTPVASPVNMLVLQPGGYRFNDFVRVGVPLQLLAMVITLLAVPAIFPLSP